MAAFNVTLDDSSPLITYTPSNAWHDTPANDFAAKLYSRSSLHTSSIAGAAAELTFNGTGLWLYGGFRPSYGSYAVSVDGAQILRANATAPDLELRSLLAGVSGLDTGQHTVTLTSDGTGPIDIDYAIFETNVGTLGASLTNITVDDTNSQMQYSPSASDWQQDSSSMFYNDSLHYSQTTGAQASLSFSGDAIAVYGTVSPLHANYTVCLDGVISQEFNASDVRILHTQTLLYFAQNLSSSDHKLVITGLGANGTGQYVDIDFISIYSAANDSTATATHESGSSVGSATSGSSTTGAPSVVGGMTNPSLNSAADK
ncbi:uncharacterized protein LAESUDRAFT_344342 [Laetiporus sulphureus 93-53]|uniref:Carbohydrate-binding module family 35 protein n=1 Tax=Laetiporus sulphureus 93-53 TaxID=1314785 RepID=A0A165GQS3_9APHY|nr:uncharacterized protein LAESUDRAFT_344342 [Laetiporus sulphureus 93-53]KZT10677.1 hypothetical protein LAESUDRAFT_344342 [Laetiporus sulphureus 93-53]